MPAGTKIFDHFSYGHEVKVVCAQVTVLCYCSTTSTVQRKCCVSNAPAKSYSS